MDKRKLQIQQLDQKMVSFLEAEKVAVLQKGWINAIRTALGMSLQQVSKRLGISRQSVQAMEKREMEGSITLQALNEAAKSMDMKLVYGFVPIDGSLDALITRKSYQLATEIVNRTSNTMKLENQENSTERIKKAIDERAQQLKSDLSKMLWD